MINIAGSVANYEDIAKQYNISGIEKSILEAKSSASETYSYGSIDELKFELEMRKNIIHASNALYTARMRFRTFRESICNEDYWKRTEEGGFKLKEGVKPSDAISDIFINGRKYGTECATAIVIIFYKAVLDIYKPDLFDRLFRDIYLMNWKEASSHLGVKTYRDIEEFFLGDCRYFANPDVNPLTPEWQGENAILLGNNLFYGHGIGKSTAEVIIAALNRNRISGSDVSAHLLDTATRPDFKKLAGNL